MSAVATRAGRKPAGFVILYRRGEENFCPVCQGRNWNVDRVSAECAWCGMVLGFAQPTEAPAITFTLKPKEN